jgi:hypothetical protein
MLHEPDFVGRACVAARRERLHFAPRRLVLSDAELPHDRRIDSGFAACVLQDLDHVVGRCER